VNKILVGLDGSQAAQTALDFAADLAAHYDAELHILSVGELPEIGDDIETEAIVDKAEAAAQDILGSITTRYPGVFVITAARVGHAAEHLLRYADENDVDHIVLGHRGRSFFDRWLLGSVSRRVVAYANCTVTITRPT
jgi:nucleotide-binding universal stress UspA family protein